MWGTPRDPALSPNENLGISNLLPAMWIRAIFIDRDLQIECLPKGRLPGNVLLPFEFGRIYTLHHSTRPSAPPTERVQRHSSDATTVLKMGNHTRSSNQSYFTDRATSRIH